MDPRSVNGLNMYLKPKITFIAYETKRESSPLGFRLIATFAYIECSAKIRISGRESIPDVSHYDFPCPLINLPPPTPHHPHFAVPVGLLNPFIFKADTGIA